MLTIIHFWFLSLVLKNIFFQYSIKFLKFSYDISYTFSSEKCGNSNNSTPKNIIISFFFVVSAFKNSPYPVLIVYSEQN